MNRLALTLVIVASPSMGGASSLCDELAALTKSDAETVSVARAPAESATCTRSIGLGGTKALHCGWPFGYRSAEAQIAFEAMLGDVRQCADPITVPPSVVNHPDSYDLLQFNFGPAIVSVSLKDKAALAKTYVFLRIEQP